MKTPVAMVAVLSTLAVAATCGPAEDPKPHVTPVPGAERCGAACDHMSVVGPDGGPCEEAMPVPLPDGGIMSCSEFCLYEHANGVYWNTECLTTITDCAQIESTCNEPPP